MLNPWHRERCHCTATLHSYVGYLRAMAVIHGVLEGELSRSKDPAVMAVWNDSMRKPPLISTIEWPLSWEICTPRTRANSAFSPQL